MPGRAHLTGAALTILSLAVSGCPFGESQPPEGATLAQQGEFWIEDLGCRSCHQIGSGYRAPELEKLAGTQRLLKDGRQVPFDSDYIKRALEEPRNEVVKGYQASMPSYQLEPLQLEAITSYLLSPSSTKEP